MLFSQSQFYDIIQYAENKELDPKIFTHKKSDTVKKKNFLRKEVTKKVEPYSIIGIKNTEYYFKVEVNILDYLRRDVHLNSPSTYIVFGDKLPIEKEYDGKHNIYFHVFYSPGAIHFHTMQKQVGLQNDFRWYNIFEYAKLWVDSLVDEIHAIESISKINMIPDFFSTYRAYENVYETYSGNQGEMIKEKVKTLKHRVNQEIPMDDNQIKIINEKLDELIMKVDKINKFDYRTFFFGMLTNIASSVLYDSAPQFWGIVKSIFGNTMIGSDNTSVLI